MLATGVLGAAVPTAGAAEPKTSTTPDTSYGTAVLYPAPVAERPTPPGYVPVQANPFTSPPTALVPPKVEPRRPAPTRTTTAAAPRRRTGTRTTPSPTTRTTAQSAPVAAAPEAPPTSARTRAPASTPDSAASGISPILGDPAAPRRPSREQPFVARKPTVETRLPPSSSILPESTRAQRAPALDEPDGSAFGRTVGDIVEVVPMPVRLALAGLGALVLLLTINAVISRTRTRRLESQHADLLDDIGTLQAALLPAVPELVGELSASVAYRPAATLAAGGDFYDAFELDQDGRVGLLLGDVSGHGKEALTKTTLVRFTVRAYLEAGLPPRAALAVSGRALEGRMGDDFATVVAAIYDSRDGTLTYACAGHPPPLVLGPGYHVPVTAASSPPLGSGFPTGQRETILPMPAGTTVCLFSDGLLDARLGEDEVVGRERLASWLAELGPGARAGALVDLVVRRAHRVTDDLAACIVHAATKARPPAFRVEHLKIDVLDDGPPRLLAFLKACGVPEIERATAEGRVDAQLGSSGACLVEVVLSDPPSVAVLPLGDELMLAPSPAPSTPV